MQELYRLYRLRKHDEFVQCFAVLYRQANDEEQLKLVRVLTTKCKSAKLQRACARIIQE